jgi:hypothetical protein
VAERSPDPDRTGRRPLAVPARAAAGTGLSSGCLQAGVTFRRGRGTVLTLVAGGVSRLPVRDPDVPPWKCSTWEVSRVFGPDLRELIVATRRYA